MNNKGFTLIELLAVVVLLALLVVLGSTSVAKSIKQSRQRAYETDIETFIVVTKSWALDHTEQLPSLNSSTRVTLQMLMDAGLIEKGKINPLTKEPYSTSMTFCIYNTNNTYRYEYKESGTC